MEIVYHELPPMNSALKLVEVESLLFSYGCVGDLHTNQRGGRMSPRTKHSRTGCRLKKI